MITACSITISTKVFSQSQFNVNKINQYKKKKEWGYSKTIWKQFSDKQIHKNKCMSINTKIAV